MFTVCYHGDMLSFITLMTLLSNATHNLSQLPLSVTDNSPNTPLNSTTIRITVVDTMSTHCLSKDMCDETQCNVFVLNILFKKSKGRHPHQ